MKKPTMHTPPRWADRMLKFFISDELLEEIQGDLYESFYWRLEKKGAAYAKRQFIKESFLSARISNLKKPHYMQQFITLFRSYLTSGWRYLWKTRTYSSINIIGLSIGIVFSWFAYIYAKDQLSYNRHFKDVESLYRLSITLEIFDNIINLAGCTHSTTERILNEIPEVAEMARFTDDRSMIKAGGSTIETGYLMAEKNLISYLDLKFVEGTAGTFDSPDQAVISESMAYKLNIRGEAADHHLEILDSADYVSYQIIGVYEDIPSNSSIHTDIILPYKAFIGNLSASDPKLTYSVSTILKVEENANVTLLKSKIDTILNSEDTPAKYIAQVVPLKDLYLSDNYFANKGFLPGGNKQLIWLIVLIGAFCLIISAINYANFSISMYLSRAREVAVRKIMGSPNFGVFQQLMTESLITVIISALVAVVLFALLSPFFSELVEKQFTPGHLFTAEFVPGLIAILIVITVLSGFYPSMLLSKFRVIKSLRGLIKTNSGKLVMQGFLVIQFMISIIMITCMLTFNSQLKHLTDFDPGHRTKDLIRLRIPYDVIGNQIEPALREELAKIPEIQQISVTTGIGMISFSDEDINFNLNFSNIDSTYLDVMGLKLIKGYDLEEARRRGISNGIIVNETFIKKFPDMAHPIGKKIPVSITGQNNSVIAGVVKDYYHMGIRSKISPLALYSDNPDKNAFSILIDTRSDRYALDEKLSMAWSKVYGAIPVSYDYVDYERDKSLENEARITKIAGFGSLIAILIASFGLLGLIGLTLQRKLKEVSIRRILGAGSRSLSFILIRNFSLPILISLFAGLSIATFLSHEWLSDYNHRISFGWFQLTIPVIIIISLLVVITLMQVIRITSTNPSVHLRNE